MSYQEQISNLFRLVEADLGTKKLNDLVLQTLSNAVFSFQAKTWESFVHQFHDLLDAIESTQPRFAIVIDNFYEVWELIREERSKHRADECPDICPLLIQRQIEAIREKNAMEAEILGDNGMSCIADGDTILIHDHSATVLSVLQKAKEENRKFSVIVAEQDLNKSHAIVEFLSQEDISFQVIPSYMLSHIEDRIDKAFFGAVTFKNTYDFVMDAGSNAVISEFHLQKKPCYLFISTSKFSLWESVKKQHEVHHVRDTRKHKSKPISFERLKFSHDRVPLDYFDKIITERGVHTGLELLDLYKELYKQRQEHELEIEQKFGAQN